ncbi:AGAP010005-PA-like protein [Anopheles sinensis]|uniref:AGAP010005-PA-like protein n=1 Tax=Anopheles sinensis TaxID=74873 RepID=A0A084VSP1_ANOSI|nr:AGAP010005-PA-like protein [Anopheles sinensis]
MNYKFDTSDLTRRLKRTFDGNVSYRKLFLLLFVVAVFLLYIGPSFLRWLFGHAEPTRDHTMRCMDDRLTPFYLQNFEYNVNIRHQPAFPHEHDAIPYVGNGWFGLEVHTDAHLNIFRGRALQQPVNFHPIVSVASGGQSPSREATVVEYLSGIVHRFQCFPDGYHVSYQYYAHRTMPSVLVQEIQLTNTKNQLTDIELIVPRISDWPSAIVKSIKLQHGSAILEYQVVTGMVDTMPVPGNTEDSKVRAVSIVARKLPRVLTLKKRGTTKLELLLTIHYSEPVPRDKYTAHKDLIEKQAVDAMNKALVAAEHGEHNAYHNLKRDHIAVWNKLWATGFHISTSKAENTLNGNNINATMYAVISQARAFEYEQSVTGSRKDEIARALTYAEGCYDSYHTLQAENLWRHMSTFEELNAVVGSWMLTLEKQGCHNLIKAGASGIVQAMVLSFGGFRFSNQHLELNIHPKYLHRDYDFRRLNYGNMTHLNISITVREDNKAILYVALDRSDRNYYACDAGCLDDPVQLRQSRLMFPVKLTEPVTSILYITSDRKHMEDLRHAIHVKEVVEAPAHEHHVIALHRHGHHLGGLPTLFWVSICVIIIVFHVFLCKLIVKEYCEPPDKMRYRYSKP